MELAPVYDLSAVNQRHFRHFQFLVQRDIKPPALGLQSVQAATAEIHDEHLVLLDSNGRLAAFFLLDNVESWSDRATIGDLGLYQSSENRSRI